MATQPNLSKLFGGFLEGLAEFLRTEFTEESLNTFIDEYATVLFTQIKLDESDAAKWRKFMTEIDSAMLGDTMDKNFN